ncbi:MAG: hypothetical protein EA412_14675 [Chitinophagaceae bacterium]|nr:MAG: hypothetical protein EA412_14675 [Chitinophagaceae bacterium]
MPVQTSPIINPPIDGDRYLYRSFNSPSSDLLEFVINQIYSDSLFQIDFYDMINYYGIPRINWSTIDIKSETNYVISIPLIKNGKITSFILYSAFIDYYQITFQSLHEVFYKLNTNTITLDSFTGPETLALLKYSNLLFLTRGLYSPAIYNWIDENQNEFNSNFSTERTQVTIDVMVVKVFNYGWNSDVYSHTFDITIECQGDSWTGWVQPPSGGGGGGGGGTGGGGGSSGSGNPPETEEIPDIEFIHPNHIDKDCFYFSFTPDAIEELLSIANGVTQKCSNDQSPSEAVASILENLCDSPQGGDNAQLQAALANINGDIIEISNNIIDRDMIRDEFAGEDDWVMTSGIGGDCSKLKCLLAILLDNNPDFESPLNSHLFCARLHYFLGRDLENDRHLYILSESFDEASNINTNANAFVTILYDDNNAPQVGIIFNSDKCENTSTFDLFNTFIHELIHADLWRRLIEDYGFTSINDEQHAFELLLTGMGYDGTNWDDQHQLMLDYYVIEMATILWEATGEIGEIIDYIGYVLNGFPLDLIVESGWYENEVQTLFEIQKSLDFIKNIEPFHSNFNLCD